MKAKIINQSGVHILNISHNKEVFNLVGKEIDVSKFNSQLQYLAILNSTDLEKEIFKEWVALLQREESGKRYYLEALELNSESIELEYLVIDTEHDEGVKIRYECYPDCIMDNNLVLNIYRESYLD